jgi:polysaccharide biosynthesis protein PslH
MAGKHLLLLIPYRVLPAKMGGEKSITILAEKLAQHIPITAVSVKSNDTSSAKNFSLLNILSDSRFRYVNVGLFVKLRRLIRENHSSYLMIEHPYFGWLAYLLKRATGVKWIVRSQNIEYQRSRSIGRRWWKMLKWYEGWVHRNADVNLFISDSDRQLALDTLGVTPEKSFTVDYGIMQKSLPENIDSARQTITERYSLSKDTKILLFNGALYHHTNYEPVRIILDKINPYLLSRVSDYRIIICGKGLPDEFNELKEYSDKRIIYAGFVDDVSMYFKAADIFLNPIISGGGVKTKAIEAIAMNCTVVSTAIGAMGIRKDLAGEKLRIVNDEDWPAFNKRLIESFEQPATTSQAFYDHYNWDLIAERAAKLIDA